MPLEGAKLPRDGGEPLGVAPGHETGSPVQLRAELVWRGGCDRAQLSPRKAEPWADKACSMLVFSPSPPAQGLPTLSQAQCPLHRPSRF